MSRTTRIAGVALAGGILMATAIAIATREEPPRREPPPVIEEAADPLRAELARCRTITGPDADCERVWQAQRDRFFGRNDVDTSAPRRDALIGEGGNPAHEETR